MSEQKYELSDTEQKLYEFIKISKETVTTKVIQEVLGEKYLGALGKLVSLGKIEQRKKESENKVHYRNKQIKYYAVVEDK